MRGAAGARAEHLHRAAIAPVDAPLQHAVVARVGGREVDAVGAAAGDRRTAGVVIQRHRGCRIGDGESAEGLCREPVAIGAACADHIGGGAVVDAQCHQLCPAQGHAGAVGVAISAVAVQVPGQRVGQRAGAAVRCHAGHDGDGLALGDSEAAGQRDDRRVDDLDRAFERVVLQQAAADCRARQAGDTQAARPHGRRRRGVVGRGAGVLRIEHQRVARQHGRVVAVGDGGGRGGQVGAGHAHGVAVLVAEHLVAGVVRRAGDGDPVVAGITMQRQVGAGTCRAQLCLVIALAQVDEGVGAEVVQGHQVGPRATVDRQPVDIGIRRVVQADVVVTAGQGQRDLFHPGEGGGLLHRRGRGAGQRQVVQRDDAAVHPDQPLAGHEHPCAVGADGQPGRRQQPADATHIVGQPLHEQQAAVGLALEHADLVAGLGRDQHMLSVRRDHHATGACQAVDAVHAVGQLLQLGEGGAACQPLEDRQAVAVLAGDVEVLGTRRAGHQRQATRTVQSHARQGLQHGALQVVGVEYRHGVATAAGHQQQVAVAAERQVGAAGHAGAALGHQRQCAGARVARQFRHAGRACGIQARAVRSGHQCLGVAAGHRRAAQVGQVAGAGAAGEAGDVLAGAVGHVHVLAVATDQHVGRALQRAGRQAIAAGAELGPRGQVLRVADDQHVAVGMDGVQAQAVGADGHGLHTGQLLSGQRRARGPHVGGRVARQACGQRGADRHEAGAQVGPADRHGRCQRLALGHQGGPDGMRIQRRQRGADAADAARGQRHRRGSHAGCCHRQGRVGQHGVGQVDHQQHVVADIALAQHRAVEPVDAHQRVRWPVGEDLVVVGRAQLAGQPFQVTRHGAGRGGSARLHRRQGVAAGAGGHRVGGQVVGAVCRDGDADLRVGATEVVVAGQQRAVAAEQAQHRVGQGPVA